MVHCYLAYWESLEHLWLTYQACSPYYVAWQAALLDSFSLAMLFFLLITLCVLPQFAYIQLKELIWPCYWSGDSGTANIVVMETTIAKNYETRMHICWNPLWFVALHHFPAQAVLFWWHCLIIPDSFKLQMVNTWYSSSLSAFAVVFPFLCVENCMKAAFPAH